MNQSNSTTGLLSELKGILKIEQNEKEIKGRNGKEKGHEDNQKLEKVHLMWKKRKRKGKNNNEHM